MPILKACAVYDTKAGFYNRPFFIPSVGMAERSFSDEVNRKSEDNAMFHHPEDFTLFLIGEYNDVTAEYTQVWPPQHLVSGATVINKEI